MNRSSGDIEGLIREEMRLTAVESQAEAWAEGLSAGIDPEIIAEAALTTALSELLRSESEHVALALLERVRERVASGEFEPDLQLH